MTTYSQSLKLTLIGDGEEAGTWGGTTNTNLGTLLEQAITGVQEIPMSNANVTLTSTNGTADQARNAVLVATGANGAVRDLIAPLVEKQYLVVNNTTGGFAINIRGSSGFSVSVPNGASVFVYCDGTNFYSAQQSYTTGNFTVGGNLTVTGNTNAANATFTGNVAALNISTANVTATGAGAFSGNVSALNISTANVTATGNATVTGNVVATGNVSGNIATFTGNSIFSSTGALKVSAGTTGERPSPTTGMFRFNSSLTRFEGYNGSNWGTLGGATGGGNDQIFYENGQLVTANYTITTGTNAMSAGPITIDTGVEVTVPTDSTWVIV